MLLYVIYTTAILWLYYAILKPVICGKPIRLPFGDSFYHSMVNLGMVRRCILGFSTLIMLTPLTQITWFKDVQSPQMEACSAGLEFSPLERLARAQPLSREMPRCRD